MIWKVLRQEFKVSQMLLIITVMFAGFSIIMLTARFYADIRPAFSGDDLWQTEHLIISKEVSPLATTGQLLRKRDKPSFSEKEMAEIKEQPFVKDLAAFTASNFKTTAYTKNKELGGFYTDLFFESVPSRYIDLDSDSWNWTETSKFIPVILPKSYLNLYNFGFATAQNLPQISEEAAGLIPFHVTVQGRGNQEQFDARIVGFSDRLNTILVPESFLQYANSEFGSKKPPVSRLILITPDPSNPDLLEYIRENKYDYNQEQLNSGKARMLLNTVTIIVLATGLFISLLALWMFILSSHLLLQKNKTNIHHLIALGYSHSRIMVPFRNLNIISSLFVFAMSLLPFFILRGIWLENLQSILPAESSGNILILAGGFVLLMILSGLNILSTARKIKRI
ncbi:MAG: ABC transporter permease [Bacteroidota bacterium]